MLLIAQEAELGQSWLCVLVGAGILFMLFALAIGGIIWLIMSKSSKSDGPLDVSNLTPCPMCFHRVSPNAVSCPHCGEPLGTDSE
jgi:hypothetical protein